jgi:hypothetical protein
MTSDLKQNAPHPSSRTRGFVVPPRFAAVANGLIHAL